MSNKQQQKIKYPALNDPTSEQSVLSLILKNGAECFYDVDSLVGEDDFYYPENKIIYSVCKNLIDTKKVTKLELGLILQEINGLDGSLSDKYQLPDYLAHLYQKPVLIDNIEQYAKNIARSSLVRTLDTRLTLAKTNLSTVSLDKSILDIAGETEQIIFDFSNKLLTNEQTTSSLSTEIDTFLEDLLSNKGKSIGIPTGFTLYDKAIGGGIRAPGVAVIGARPKCGKTSTAINFAKNVAASGVPVLYLDTEMTKELTLVKLFASISLIDVNVIETGRFADNLEYTSKIQAAAAKLKKSNIHYHNISGLKHTQAISLIRKWIHRCVGFDENGTTKPCLVILDYIKTMDVGDMGDVDEYQYLGQYVTDMHNFGVQYTIPILAFVQLNRDGISKNDTSVISGSDRILWLCTSFSILANKSTDDLVADPITNGNKKLIVLAQRFGPGLDSNEYVNVKADLSKCYMEEGPSNVAVRQNRTLAPTQPQANTKNKQQPQTDDNDDDKIDF